MENTRESKDLIFFVSTGGTRPIDYEDERMILDTVELAHPEHTPEIELIPTEIIGKIACRVDDFYGKSQEIYNQLGEKYEVTNSKGNLLNKISSALNIKDYLEPRPGETIKIRKEA